MKVNPWWKPEHILYIEPRAKKAVGRRPGLEYVDTLPSSGTQRRDYEVGVQEQPGGFVKRLPIPLLLVERCMGSNQDAELVKLLERLLDEELPS